MNLENFNKVLRESGEKILGFKCKKKEEWIRPETWKKIDERKAIKQRINSTKSERIKDQLRGRYSLLDKEVKSLARADKRAYVDELASEAEAAAGRQDARTLYKITKVLSGKYSFCNRPVKDASGTYLRAARENVRVSAQVRKLGMSH